MLNVLLEPLQFEFMRNALFTAIMLGVLCSVVGSYLIVQRMGLLGDVIAHAVLPGLAIAFFLGVDIFLGAFIWWNSQYIFHLTPPLRLALHPVSGSVIRGMEEKL